MNEYKNAKFFIDNGAVNHIILHQNSPFDLFNEILLH